MMCYKDMTFCRAVCENSLCHRQYTPEVSEAARKWWGDDGAPIALSDFSEGCPAYVRPEGCAKDQRRSLICT